VRTLALQKYLNEKIAIAGLVALWVAMQAIAYFHFGIRFGIDSERYVEIAEALVQGSWPHGTDIFYISYCLLIAGLQLLGLGPVWMVLVQIILAGLSLIGIYNIVRIIGGNNMTSWLACLLYILWFKFHQWNLIVYTDSLFTSSVILAIWALITANNRLRYVVAFGLIAFSVFIRPSGIGFLFAISGYMLCKQLNFEKGRMRIMLSASLLLMIISGAFLNTILKDFVPSFLDSYKKAEIIYPGISLGIQKQDGLIIPEGQSQPFTQLLVFTFQNPIYMIKISTLKAILFIGHVKPYYSLLHNLFIGFFLYPIYVFAVVGARQIQEKRIQLFIGVFVGFSLLTVSLTSENWDGRFLLPVLPWISMLASFGLSKLLPRN